MELVREINCEKRDWRRDIGITATAVGIVFVCADIWLPVWLVTKWFHALAATFVAFGLHELAHGLLFKLWTGRVKFGAGLTKFGPVFYASSPGSLLPRNKMLLIALAPQVLTIVYFLLSYLPLLEPIRVILVLAGIMNLAGGSADFYCVVRMLEYPRELQVEDYPAGVRFYMPVKGGSSESIESVT